MIEWLWFIGLWFIESQFLTIRATLDKRETLLSTWK
jgi:hypothetical protein